MRFNNIQRVLKYKYMKYIQGKQAEKFIVKFTLNFKSIGKESYQRSYFVFEIVDVRKRDLIGKSISENQNL